MHSLADKLAALGGRLILVGGCVRDLLRAVQPTDFDAEVFGLTADALEAVLEKSFPFKKVGRAFGVYKLKGYPIDISLPRLEEKSGQGHRAFHVQFPADISFEEAAARRDFTINAMGWDLLRGELLDPFNGREDWDNRRLDACTDKFMEDPLRVLRGMQFAGRFECRATEQTLRYCRQMTMENLPPERLWEEWKKFILQSTKPSLGLEFLKDAGWLQYFPELASLVDCPQNPRWHPEGDVWKHTLHCMDAFAEQRTGPANEDLIVGLAVLCHDMGKPLTTIQKNGEWVSPGHAEQGQEPTERFLGRLTREKSLIESVVRLVTNHMHPHSLYKNKAGDQAVKRLSLRTGGLDLLLRVVEADKAGRPPLPPGSSEDCDWLRERARQLKVAEAAPKPIMQGRHLLKLGFQPGPQLGKILDGLFEAQLEGSFSTIEEGLAFAEQQFSVKNKKGK